MFESLRVLLEADPTLIAVFAGLSMMVVQMLKSSLSFVERNPMLYVLGLSIFFSSMIVYEVETVLGIAILTFLIMSAASGVYASSKDKTVIDYSDTQ